MALMALGSAAGSPGVTTLAVGLALTWDRSVILVDADPGAHQAVLAGYLQGRVPTDKGLQRVAEAHRDRRPLAEVAHDQTVPLTQQGAHDRRLLPGFARSANAALFGPVWPNLIEALLSYEAAGIDIIVDLGRIQVESLSQALLQRADLVALTMRSSLRAVAAARSCAGFLSDPAQAGAGGDRNAGLIVVGENQPYSRREIGHALQLPVVAAIADDAGSAAALSDGCRRSRKFDQAPLAKSLHHTCSELHRWFTARRDGLGCPQAEEAPTAGGSGNGAEEDADRASTVIDRPDRSPRGGGGHG